MASSSAGKVSPTQLGKFTALSNVAFPYLTVVTCSNAFRLCNTLCFSANIENKGFATPLIRSMSAKYLSTNILGSLPKILPANSSTKPAVNLKLVV